MFKIELLKSNEWFKNYLKLFIVLIVFTNSVIADSIQSTVSFEDAFKHGGYLSQKDNYPVIENFDHYLSPFGFSNCLISVENARHLNLEYPSSTPFIMIGISHLLALTAFSPRNFYVLGPKHFSQWNLTSVSSFQSNVRQFIFKCPFSEHFQTFQLTKDHEICLRLNLSKYVSKTKSWNCEVNIILYPNSHENLQPKLLSHFSKYLFPSFPSPSLKIYVYEQISIRTRVSLLESFQRDRGHNCDWVILLFLVHRIKSEHSQNFLEPVGQFINLELLKICQQTRAKENHDPIGIPIKYTELYNLNKLKDQTLPSLGSNLVWFFGESASRDTIFGLMELSLRYCAGGRLKSHLNTVVEQIGYGYSLTWISAIGNNYTITSEYTFPCIKGIKLSEASREFSPESDVSLEFIPYLKTQAIFPYFPQESLTGLRFVSCGRKGLSSIPFYELVHVYDHLVWVMIIASSVILAILINQLVAPKGSFMEAWISTLKILLEQSDKMVHQKRFRYLISLFILAGVVLSNAYKNTNIYHMVTPRQPIPYEFASELLRDNFSMLTRLDAVGGTLSLSPTSDLFRELNLTGASYQVEEGDENFIVGISEVATVMRKFLNALSPTSSYSLPEIHRLQEAMAKTLMNSSGVLASSRMSSAVKEHLSNFTLLRNWRYYEAQDRIQLMAEQAEKIRNIEADVLYAQLQDCKRVALILPEYLCHEYSKRVKLETKRPDVFVGKELYTEIKWMFSINGIWPRQFTSRIKVLYESGHWLKWTKLFSKVDSTSMKNDEVTSARMDGNIVVVFFVWMCGYLAAICCHFLEIIISI